MKKKKKKLIFKISSLDVELVEGIFRKSGSDKEIQSFKKKISRTNKINLYKVRKERKKLKKFFKKEKEFTKNVHNISGLIITTLQDISDPITTYYLYDDFLSVNGKQKILKKNF